MRGDLIKQLVGKEMSFIELDNAMMEKGFYSVFDDGATDEIKECLNVVYTSKETNEPEIAICFEITIDNGEDEAKEAFYLKVVSVEDF